MKMRGGDLAIAGTIKTCLVQAILPLRVTTNCTLLLNLFYFLARRSSSFIALSRFFFAHLGKNTNQKWHSERCQKNFPTVKLLLYFCLLSIRSHRSQIQKENGRSVDDEKVAKLRDTKLSFCFRLGDSEKVAAR